MDEPNKKKLSDGWLPRRSAGWLLLLFFVSGWMFFLGVLVGRETAPVRFNIDKLQNELAVLKEADIRKQLSRVEVDSDTAKMQKDLGFYEALKDTKDDGKKYDSRSSDTSSSHKRPSTEKPVSNSNIKKKSGEPEENLTIQAASFKDPRDAEQMVEKLVKKGYPAYRIIGVVPEKGVWYRVRIGSYASSAEASATLKRLKKEGFKPYLVNR